MFDDYGKKTEELDENMLKLNYKK